MAQPPQLFGSTATSTQKELQSVPAVHVHTPDEQVSPAAVLQRRPQPPQLKTSVVVVTQEPLQLVWPIGQAAQVPPLHDRRAVASAEISAALSTRLYARTSSIRPTR